MDKPIQSARELVLAGDSFGAGGLGKVGALGHAAGTGTGPRGTA